MYISSSNKVIHLPLKNHLNCYFDFDLSTVSRLENRITSSRDFQGFSRGKRGSFLTEIRREKFPSICRSVTSSWFLMISFWKFAILRLPYGSVCMYWMNWVRFGLFFIHVLSYRELSIRSVSIGSVLVLPLCIITVLHGFQQLKDLLAKSVHKNRSFLRKMALIFAPDVIPCPYFHRKFI